MNVRIIMNLIKFLLLITILIFKMSVNGNVDGCNPPELTRSYVSFKKKLKGFFKVPDEVKAFQARLNTRKKIMKSAFDTFLKEAFLKEELGVKQRNSLPREHNSFENSEQYSPKIQRKNQRDHDYKEEHKRFKKTISTSTTTKLFNTVPINKLNMKVSQMTASQMISYHGYKSEIHVVYTKDGYTLEIHRVMPLFQDLIENYNKLALLHHGLWGSSHDWLLLGPEKALPYLMSDFGYDVWLTNARGNIYSGQDIKHNMDSKTFWNFSFHEMGVYDLPAVIDYIKNVRGNDIKINFVGHSMGGTALLVLLSTLPEYNEVMKSATLLAPLAFMYQIKGPLKLLAELYGVNGGNSLNFLGENEFMPIENFPPEVIEKYCKGDVKLCWNPLLLMASGGSIISDNILLQNVLGHTPAGMSTKTITHYLQLVKSGRFQMYDNGVVENIKSYGTSDPVSYNLSCVTSPIILFSSRDDWLCTTSDILTLLPDIPNVITHHVVKRYEFSHTDFVWGEDAPELVFRILINILSKEQIANTIDDTYLNRYKTQTGSIEDIIKNSIILFDNNFESE